MKEINRILVVSRMTRHCRKAVRFGVSLARQYGAVLTVLHVVENPFKKGWNLPTISYEEQYRKEMERIKAEADEIVNLEREKGMTILETIEEGEPKEEILKAIRNGSIDLVILLPTRRAAWSTSSTGGAPTASSARCPARSCWSGNKQRD